jgi:hypothetical protein
MNEVSTGECLGQVEHIRGHQFTDSDYPFGIFKLFLYLIRERLVVIIRKSIALSPNHG